MNVIQSQKKKTYDYSNITREDEHLGRENTGRLKAPILYFLLKLQVNSHWLKLIIKKFKNYISIYLHMKVIAINKKGGINVLNSKKENKYIEKKKRNSYDTTKYRM